MSNERRKQELQGQLTKIVETIYRENPGWMESSIHVGPNNEATVHVIVATNRHGDEYYGVHKFKHQQEEVRLAKHGNTARPYGYLTAAEFAEKTDISHGTIRQWINRGKLPALKIGNTWFVRRNEEIPTSKNGKD